MRRIAVALLATLSFGLIACGSNDFPTSNTRTVTQSIATKVEVSTVTMPAKPPPIVPKTTPTTPVTTAAGNDHQAPVIPDNIPRGDMETMIRASGKYTDERVYQIMSYMVFACAMRGQVSHYDWNAVNINNDIFENYGFRLQKVTAYLLVDSCGIPNDW